MTVHVPTCPLTLPFLAIGLFRDYESRFQLSLPRESPDLQGPGSGLVEMNGIEPMTPCLQSRCSPS